MDANLLIFDRDLESIKPYYITFIIKVKFSLTVEALIAVVSKKLVYFNLESKKASIIEYVTDNTKIWEKIDEIGF